MRPVLLKLIVAVLALECATSENITFNNVTIKWKFNIGETTSLVTSDSLKKNVPTDEEVSVEVRSDVPVMYERSVSDIENLKSLTISGVGLGDIKPGAISNLPNLERLILNNNKLILITNGTFCDLNVASIDLSRNSITVLQQSAFKNLTVRHLTFSNNKLTEFPNGVFENVTLTSLSLYGNHLHTIAPKALSSIALANLVLSSNKLKEVNPESFDLPDLVSLDLAFNSIKLMRSGDLKNLPQLQSLELVANKLEEIPEGLFNNTKLTHLKLNYNQIVAISSKAFDDMASLSVLHFDYNKLTRWDNEWVGGTSKPAYVLAGFNQFTEIPDEAFKNYPRLYSIDLQGNKIRKVSEKAFKKLENVVNFSLRDNEIDRWDPDLLVGVSVGTIDLSGNKLRCIEEDLDKVFGNTDFVHLWGNPWDEGCVRKVEEFTKRKESAPKTRAYVGN